MRGDKDPERLDALKERLYARDVPPRQRQSHDLTDEPVPVRDSWDKPPVAKQDIVPIKKDSPEPQPENPVLPEEEEYVPPVATNDDSMSRSKTRRSYRIKILMAAVFFFVVAVGLSSLFILFGGNTISGENISISVTGPFTVGGGETVPLQIGITNQNNVPIEAATLIVDYPVGTLSADDEQKELFVERLPLDEIGSGEVVNIPVRARLFGEENDELMIRASIEYRVRGSNATFFKEAEPLRIKISSSPVTLEIESLQNISSGQETEIMLKVRSNSSTKLSDLLIKADYPNGFEFVRSNPDPVAGQNAWMIGELDPEEEVTIDITGLVTGQSTDERSLNFTVGVPNSNDQSSLASVFAVASTGFTIEDPFVNVLLEVNDQSGETVSVNVEERARVSLEIKNTLSDSIYDVKIETKLSGNALSGAEIDVNNGFYDSNRQVITWESVAQTNLNKVDPGDTERFSFIITPSSKVPATPQILLDTSVKARRVSDSQAAEELVGAVKTTIKVASAPSLVGATTHNSGSFSDIGPVPPRVGQTTSYTIALRVTNGTNDITGGTMTATLPTYVNWLDNTAGRGDISFNETTREVKWEIGSMQASESISGSFQVSILPSTSQIGKTPTLLETQYFNANDRFTGSSVRTTNGSVNTNMSEEFGYGEFNGYVAPAN